MGTLGYFLQPSWKKSLSMDNNLNKYYLFSLKTECIQELKYPKTCKKCNEIVYWKNQ